MPLPQQVDSNGLGSDDVEEGASLFDIAEIVTTRCTKTSTLWTASHSVSHTMEEYRNCGVEKVTSAAERADSAMLKHPKWKGLEGIKFGSLSTRWNLAARSLRAWGHWEIGVVVLREEDCVAAHLWQTALWVADCAL